MHWTVFSRYCQHYPGQCRYKKLLGAENLRATSWIRTKDLRVSISIVFLDDNSNQSRWTDTFNLFFTLWAYSVINVSTIIHFTCTKKLLLHIELLLFEKWIIILPGWVIKYPGILNFLNYFCTYFELLAKRNNLSIDLSALFKTS